MPSPEFKNALQTKIRKVEEAREFWQEAQKIENEAYAFIWREVNSIAPLLEKRITLYSPMDSRYSPGDLFIRDSLGFQVQEGSTTLLVSVRKSFDLSTISVKLETKEEKVAQRRDIVFQISKHGTDQRPIWQTRLFTNKIEKDRDDSFERLEIGLRILELINSRAVQNRP